MKTLSLEGFRTPMVKILAGVFLASTLITAPLVWAQESLPDVAAKIVAQFKLSRQQTETLLLANKYATQSDPKAIQALMLKESTANPNVKSVGNCHGVLQIMTSTAQSILRTDPALRSKYFGESKPTKAVVTKRLKADPVFSIEVADRILAYDLSRGASIEHALLAYNIGSVKAARVKSPTKYPYVKSVMQKMKDITEPMQQLINSTDGYEATNERA